MRKTGKAITLWIMVVLILSGCGKADIAGRPQMKITEYEKANYQTSYVLRSDVTPVLSLTLNSCDRDTRAYGMLEETLGVEEILVEIGDEVKPGDVLVTFSSKDDEKREEQMRTYNTRREEDLLLIEHYTTLQNLAPERDYQTDIDLLNDDVKLMDVYIDELNRQQAEMSLTADIEGIVTDINKDMYKGYATAASALVRVMFGTDKFKAETEDPYEFRIGDVYEARAGKATADMRVTGVEKDGGVQTVFFVPEGDSSALDGATLVFMDIQKPVIKDAVYVEKSAIVVVDFTEYVYLIDDNGFRSVRQVESGSRFGDYVVITSGLEGGEQVVIY